MSQIPIDRYSQRSVYFALYAHKWAMPISASRSSPFFTVFISFLVYSAYFSFLFNSPNTLMHTLRTLRLLSTLLTGSLLFIRLKLETVKIRFTWNFSTNKKERAALRARLALKNHQNAQIKENEACTHSHMATRASSASTAKIKKMKIIIRRRSKNCDRPTDFRYIFFRFSFTFLF